jgi:hypothetical protein
MDIAHDRHDQSSEATEAMAAFRERLWAPQEEDHGGRLILGVVIAAAILLGLVLL